MVRRWRRQRRLGGGCIRFAHGASPTMSQPRWPDQTLAWRSRSRIQRRDRWVTPIEGARCRAGCSSERASRAGQRPAVGDHRCRPRRRPVVNVERMAFVGAIVRDPAREAKRMPRCSTPRSSRMNTGMTRPTPRTQRNRSRRLACSANVHMDTVRKKRREARTGALGE